MMDFDIVGYQRELTERLSSMDRQKRLVFAAIMLESLTSKGGNYLSTVAGHAATALLQELVDVLWILILQRDTGTNYADIRSRLMAIEWGDRELVAAGEEALDECAIQTLSCAIAALDCLETDSPECAADAAICRLNVVYCEVLWDRGRTNQQDPYDDPRLVSEIACQARLVEELAKPNSIASRMSVAGWLS